MRSAINSVHLLGDHTVRTACGDHRSISTMFLSVPVVAVSVFLAAIADGAVPGGYRVGDLLDPPHEIAGRVYIHKRQGRIVVEDFTFDGSAPEAIFIASNVSRTPIANAEFKYLPYDGYGANGYLHTSYHPPTRVSLQVSDVMPVETVKWFALWCEKFSVYLAKLQVLEFLDDLVSLSSSGNLFGYVYKAPYDNTLRIEQFTDTLVPNQLTYKISARNGLLRDAFLKEMRSYGPGVVHLTIGMPNGVRVSEVTRLELNDGGRTVASTKPGSL